MKTWKAMLVATTIALTTHTAALAHNGPAVIALPAHGITADGDLSDWPRNLIWTPLPHTGFGEVSGPTDLSGRFAVAIGREAGKLYVALDVADDTIVREPQDTNLPAIRNNPDGALVYLDLLHRGSFTESIEMSWVRRPILAVDQRLMDEELFEIARAETAQGVAYEFEVDLNALYAHYGTPNRPALALDAVLGLNIEYWDRDSDEDGAILRWTAGPRDGEDSRVLGDLFILNDPEIELARIEGRAAWDDRDDGTAPGQVVMTRAGDPDFAVWGGTHPDGVFHVKVPPGDYEVRVTDPSTLLRESEVYRLSVDDGQGQSLDRSILTRADNAPLDQLVIEMMAETGTRTVGVAVVEGGEIAYARTFGLQVDGTPADDDTIFRVASITKPVSATAVFSLVAQERWSLDTPLTDHWVDPDLSEDPRASQLNSRLVMRHLTGLPNWRGGRDLRFTHDPDQHQSYSGEGYEWMRRAVERAFDEDFNTINAREVFEPAGMTSTTHGWPDWVAPRFAGEYFASGTPVNHSTRTEANAAANLLTTPTDLARYAIWFMNTRAGMSEAAWQDMITANARDIIPEDHWSAHGLSWLVHTDDDRLVLEHSGGQWGIRTHLILLPEEDRALVVLTNSSAGWPLVQRVFDATLNADSGLPNSRTMMYGIEGR